jgi:hypothetical protein
MASKDELITFYNLRSAVPTNPTGGNVVKTNKLRRYNTDIMAGNDINRGKFMLHRCPRCNRANIGHFVLRGVCTWCGYSRKDIINASSEIDPVPDK